MARGTNLTRLLQMLRAEVGHSTSVAAGVDNEAALIQKLQRNQEMLYDEVDWPFMQLTEDEGRILLQAGQRYYDFPTNLNLEATVKAAIDYSTGRPVPIKRGIGFEEYAQYDSELDQRASPARKWDIKRTAAGSEQIEIWPIPSDNTQIFRLGGKKKLRALVAPGDVADLDDILIVLTSAHEILARAKHADATKVEAAASKRLSQLKGRTKGGSRMITLSGSSAQNNNSLGRTIIRIGSQTN